MRILTAAMLIALLVAGCGVESASTAATAAAAKAKEAEEGKKTLARVREKIDELPKRGAPD